MTRAADARPLDRARLDPVVRELARQLDRPDIWERFRAVFGPPPPRRRRPL